MEVSGETRGEDNNKQTQQVKHKGGAVYTKYCEVGLKENF